jgi:hypothetical protein
MISAREQTSSSLAGGIERSVLVMLVQAERGDFESSIISSYSPSWRGYADQTGIEVPISATLALTIFVSQPRPFEMCEGSRGALAKLAIHRAIAMPAARQSTS